MKFNGSQIVVMIIVSVILVLVVVPNLIYGITVVPGYFFISGLGVGIVYAARDEKKTN